MKITVHWLREKAACSDGIRWFLERTPKESIDVLKLLISEDRLVWANWLIVRVMIRPQYLAYAIFAAGQVLSIFEKKYPKDNRPRKAIEAAGKVLEHDTKANRAAAADAASAAATAAADAASTAYAVAAYANAAATSATPTTPATAAAYANAAYAAATSATPATAAADAASTAYAIAGDAAYANAAAARIAAADGDAAAAHIAGTNARIKMKLKILKYGMELLKSAEKAAQVPR